jgi:hypothetical protein
MVFSDGRTCREWLKTIPLTNVLQAQQVILDALRDMSRAELAAIERLTCLELMRDKVAFLQAEQRARHTGKTIPLSHGDMTSWETSRVLVEEMEAGYRKCFAEATSGEPGMEPHFALIIQRIMRYIGLQMLFAGLIYRRFDPALWARLHQQWIEAEGRRLVHAMVKDSVGSVDGISSVCAAYVAVLLAQMANTHELATRQIDFVDTILKRFAAKVTVEADPALCAASPLLVVDLFDTEGVQRLPYQEAAEHLRFLNIDGLSKSLRGRILKLREGEAPGNLNLPADWSIPDCLAQLSRLLKIWCEGGAMRPPSLVPDETQATLSFGIGEIHYFVSDDIFEQPGKKRELTRQELNDIAMFGKISEANKKARHADVAFSTENWGVVNEGKGFVRLLRPSQSARGVAIGRLVGVRMGTKGAKFLAVVREIVQELEGSIFVVLGRLPGEPEAIAMRSTDMRNRPGSQFVQGFRLPAVPDLKEPETLIIPSGVAQPGRGIDVFAQGQGESREITLHEFVERGSDFERVATS